VLVKGTGTGTAFNISGVEFKIYIYCLRFERIDDIPMYGFLKKNKLFNMADIIY
jgi:hypothetical protein